MCAPRTQNSLLFLFLLLLSKSTLLSQERLIDSSQSIVKFDEKYLSHLIDSDSIYNSTMLLNETLAFARRKGLKKLEAQSINGLGILFSKMGNFKNAEIYFYKSLSILDSLNKPLLKNYVLSGLTNNYLLEKNYKKFDSIYPITQKLSLEHNSILEFVNLEREIRKNYYQNNNDLLKKLTEQGLQKLQATNFNTLTSPRTYPESFKLNLKESFKYYNAIAQVKLKAYKAKGFDLLFAIDEDKLKQALKQDKESYSKLATYNYYKYLYFNDVKKDLDSANKYLLKSDAYKYEALKNIENSSTKNGRLIYDTLKAQDKLHLTQEMYKKDLKISKAYLIIAVISFLALLIACLLSFYYFKARKNIIKINKKLKDQNTELQKIDKDRLEFFSILSHELRTPIYGITGLANLIEKETSETKKKTYLNSLISSSNYISVLIDNILQATKLRFSQKTLTLKPGKINDIVQNVSNTVKIAAENKGLEFKTHIDKSDDNEYILIDKVAFSQILINLAYNAIRYTKEGFVLINVILKSRTDSHVKLLFEIKDSGIGIKEEHRETVFNAFDNKLFLEKNSSGSGLGLHIVKTLLKSYNTDIDFTSTPNKGSNFFFTIDFELCSKPQIAIKKVIKPREKQHVLIVDDNKINLLITKKNIESIEGYSAETVTNGKDALELIQEKSFDLILLDINMPDMDGYQVSKYIRNLNIDTPIIALTALNSVEVSLNVEKSGMNEVITKPYNYDDFRDTILKYSKLSKAQQYF